MTYCQIRNKVRFLIFPFLLFSGYTVAGNDISERASSEGAREDNNIYPKIQLNGNVYTYDEMEKKSIFSGLVFDKEFEKILSKHPSALREAKRSYTYKAANFGGTIAITALVVKELLDTMNKADKVQNNEMVDNSFQISDLVPIAIAAVVVVVSGKMADKHVLKGVRMYNKKQRQIQPLSKPLRDRISFGVNAYDENRKNNSINVISRGYVLTGFVSYNF